MNEASLSRPVFVDWHLGAPASEVPAPGRVHLVGDDGALRVQMTRLLSVAGYTVCAYRCAELFLERHDPGVHGCVILDTSMPALNPLALQQALADRDNHMPVVFLAARADLRLCVQAMKGGAFDFLITPVDQAVLFTAVARAMEQDETLMRVRSQRAMIESRLSSLTPREREVLEHVVAGRMNKHIAADLGTVEKTIKVHRGRILHKMQVRSVAELVRLMERTGPRREVLS